MLSLSSKSVAESPAASIAAIALSDLSLIPSMPALKDLMLASDPLNAPLRARTPTTSPAIAAAIQNTGLVTKANIKAPAAWAAPTIATLAAATAPENVNVGAVAAPAATPAAPTPAAPAAPAGPRPAAAPFAPSTAAVNGTKAGNPACAAPATLATPPAPSTEAKYRAIVPFV